MAGILILWGPVVGLVDCICPNTVPTNGMIFAKLLLKAIAQISDAKLILTSIKLSPAKPLESDITIDLPLKDIENKVIIIVDDVANTGRTIFYATKPLMKVLPKKVEVAVLVDRKHKSFPIKVDYVGMSLATTMQEHIEVQIKKASEFSVFLS